MKTFTQQILGDDLINSVYEKNDTRFWKCYFAKWDRIMEGACNALLKAKPLHVNEYYTTANPHEFTIMQVTRLYYGIQKIYTILSHAEFKEHEVSNKFADDECKISYILNSANRLAYEWFSNFNEMYYDEHGILPNERTFNEPFIKFLLEFKENINYKINQ